MVFNTAPVATPSLWEAAQAFERASKQPAIGPHAKHLRVEIKRLFVLPEIMEYLHKMYVSPNASFGSNHKSKKSA